MAQPHRKPVRERSPRPPGAAAVLAVLLLAVAVPACAPFYAEPDPETGIAYVMGQLRAEVEGEVTQVAAATELAFRKLQIRERFTEVSGLDAEIIGRSGRGKAVTVTIRRTGPTTSAVRIRIGRFGDSALSRALLDEIRGQLVAAGAAPPPEIAPQ